MNIFYLTLPIFFLPLISASNFFDEETCPGDTIFSTCGSSCPNICGQATPQVCISRCTRGCFCPKGMFRSGDRCVEKEECPKECPGDTIFKECGSACPNICGVESVFCTRQCVKGCFCPNSLFRAGDRCIEKSECNVVSEKDGSANIDSPADVNRDDFDGRIRDIGDIIYASPDGKNTKDDELSFRDRKYTKEDELSFGDGKTTGDDELSFWGERYGSLCDKADADCLRDMREEIYNRRMNAFCEDSKPQYCRMKCPDLECPSGQCVMRKDNCCDLTCKDGLDGFMIGELGEYLAGDKDSSAFSFGDCMISLFATLILCIIY